MSIVLIAPKPGSPSGGCWLLHRIADLLDKMGKDAYVLQEEPYQVFWDANPISNRLIKYDINQVKPDDIVLVPEVLWLKYVNLNANKICLVQNWIWSPPLTSDIPVITVSRYLENYAKRNWNSKIVGKITPFLDDNVWGRNPVEHTKDRVLLMGRRNNYHQTMKLALEETGFSVDYVTEPLTQWELAEKLNEAEYYVHLSHPEGFVMSALEAMRSRTMVVGTTGGGGLELMHGRYETAYVVQDPWNGKYDNTHAEFQRRIIEGLIWLRDNPMDAERMRKTAFEWSLRYNQKETSEELRRIFG